MLLPSALAAAIWRITITTLAAALAVATSTSTTTRLRDGQIGALVLALSVIPLAVKGNLVARLGSLEIWIVLDVNKDIFAAVIWCDEAETLVLKELLDAASLSHV